jgi:tRNA nucleotidyltransferase/poly(A) polymerase
MGEIITIQELPFKGEIEAAGGKIYSVGGAVRDHILRKESKDLDILITGVPLDLLETILAKYGKVDNVGKSFGIIKYNTKLTGEIDIAIPRTERANGQGGYQGFDVTSDHALPIEKDLERRDFTINALAMDAEGTIIDPYGGLFDLQKKEIKMVNPLAFSDDPLRMLRAVQFASRFKFSIEPYTLHAIAANSDKIREISPERILIEFDKIVKKGSPIIGAELLCKTGLYEEIFDTESDLIWLSDFIQVRTIGEFIFSLLKHTMKDSSEFFKTNLKGDIETYKEIKALEIGRDFMRGKYRTIFEMYKTYSKSVDTLIFGELFTTLVQYMREHNLPFSLKDLPVNGNDLMELGFQGKEIGDTLSLIVDRIYAGSTKNERNSILEFAKSWKTYGSDFSEHYSENPLISK